MKKNLLLNFYCSYKKKTSDFHDIFKKQIVEFELAQSSSNFTGNDLISSYKTFCLPLIIKEIL